MRQSIKNLRTCKGLTQAYIANKVGISLTSYQRIEYGTQRPNLQTAIRIADELDIEDYQEFKNLWNDEKSN